MPDGWAWPSCWLRCRDCFALFCPAHLSPFACVPPLRYLENVPTIVPVLEKEYRNASRRLEETQNELNDLHPEKLKVRVCGCVGWCVGVIDWHPAGSDPAKLAAAGNVSKVLPVH